MIEMTYHTNRLTPAQVLYSGEYKNMDFFILNLGTHPTAYVRIPKTHKFYNKHYDDVNPAPLNFKGGIFTFSNWAKEISPYVDQPIPNGWYLGWDYAHIGDYIGGRYFNQQGRKYTTSEMLQDCKIIIDWLKEK